MTENQQRPLVTLALFAYNQEKFIAEAVNSALAQDYPNLEILISDDHSTDETWAIIESIAQRYQGPHRLRTRRNTENCGWCAHFSTVMMASSGQLVVVSAGDDISMPSRTRILAKAWQDAGGQTMALHSDATAFIDGSSKTALVRGTAASFDVVDVDNFMRDGTGAWIHGATAAYTRDLITTFGALDPKGGFEDVPMTFRALLKGKLIYVSGPLVRYRTHGGNISRIIKASEPIRTLAWIDAQVCRLEQHLTDYKIFCRISGSPPDFMVVDVLSREVSRYQGARSVSKGGFNVLAGLKMILKGKSAREKISFLFHYFDAADSGFYQWSKGIFNFLVRRNSNEIQ